MEPRMMTLQAFCEAYSISRSAAYRQIKEGALQISKVKRRTLIAQADAEEWLERIRKASRHDQ